MPRLVNGHLGGIGIVLGQLNEDTVLAGIDLDSCRHEDGTLEGWANDILTRFPTYAEVSPSGTGLKLFFLVTMADCLQIDDALLNKAKTGRQFKKDGGDHPQGVEIYFSGRYFAVTGQALDGANAQLTTIPLATINWLLSDAGPALAKKQKSGGKGGSKGRDNSRSALAFRIARKLNADGKSFEEFCEAARTDPNTASWYTEKGAVNDMRELRRTWENAAQGRSAVNTVIAEFNAKYAVVNEQGLAIVYQQVWDSVRKRYCLDRITFDDLVKFYLNRLVPIPGADGETDFKNAAKLWLSHPDRRQFLGVVVFDPKNKAPADCWNLWTGFSVSPAKGDWSLLRAHIHDVICSNNETHFTYLMGWLARLFQHPDLPGEVAVVLLGAKGAGKGRFGRWIARAWGQHKMHISNPSHLVGNFNGHLRDCVFLFADEAFFAGDRRHEGVLKALITEELLVIEAKHKNAIEVANMLHVLMATNAEWAIPASHDERRYFVLRVADNYVGDYDYFAKIDHQMENGGLAAMIHDLLNYPLDKFNVRAVPESDPLDEQRLHSLDSLARTNERPIFVA